MKMKAQELAFFGYGDAHEKIYTAAILHRPGSRREYFSLLRPDFSLLTDRRFVESVNDKERVIEPKEYWAPV